MNVEFLISVVPQTATWSAKVASIMIASNVLCIVTTRYINQNNINKNSFSLNGSFNNLTIPELLASTSLGHIVGAGTILGLSYISLL
jgi:photosystem I subunit X